MQFQMFRTMFCEIRIVLFLLSVSEMFCAIEANPQLDLPPINPKKNALSNVNVVSGKPKVLPNSYSVKIIGNDEDDDDDDVKSDEHNGNGNDVEPSRRGVSSEYDRDRSLRYGPPYIDDTNRQFYGNNNNNNNNYNNYNGDNYANRSANDEYAYRQRYNNNNNNNGDEDRYYANRNRNNEDDDRYYAQRGRDRFNNPNNYYNNGGDGGGRGGGVGGVDEKYYADRNLARDPPYYRNENDGNRYGSRYPYTNNQNGDGRPYYQNDNGGPPDGRDPPYRNENDGNQYGSRYPYTNNPNGDGRPYYQNENGAPPDGRFPEGRFPDGNQYDEQARIEQERQYRLEEANLRRILADVDERSAIECSLNVGAQWNFETNANEVTQQEATAAQQRFSDFQRHLWEQVQTVDRNRVLDDGIYRQLRFLSVIGPNALPADQLDRYYRIINDMLAIYNKASICAFERPFDCGLKLQPDLKQIMARSRDWDELLYVWGEWRRKSGENMKELYEQLIDLTNEAARYNNFTNAAEYWTFPFESNNIRQEAENVWTEILPLYELIHAYVRRKLREFYGPNRINRNAPLPDHVLGNMYAQTWTNILDITIPFPGRSFLDVTPDMVEQGYTPQVMFQLAEEFFLSINMTALPTDFWLDSVLERPPPDRPVLCQPSAWDFCDGKTYRIKMCTNVNHKDLITVHHEMAHIQYFMNYRHQPKVFRDGANAGKYAKRFFDCK